MFKKAIVIGFSVAAVAFAGIAFAGNGAETITLKGGSLGDVTFPHKLHQEKLNNDCDACHKLFAQEAGSIEKAIAAGTLKKKEAMKQCEACHKEKKSAGEATGPTSCKGCHKK